jgi:two-component system LytT family response regulator
VTTTALIVDDEVLARRRLGELLRERDDVEVVGEAVTGLEAVRMIDTLQPDVVFLDIELPELNGLDVLRMVNYQPLVVFTTAYDRYAVSAFELAAVDYLLKPFGAERLATALTRLPRDRGDLTDVSPVASRTTEVMDGERNRPLSRFFVRDRGKLVPVSVRDVERLQADDDYVQVFARGRVHLVYLTLNDFERRLDPQRFLRVHRGHIVNLDFVRHLLPADGGRIDVEMHDGTRISASRSRSRDLRNLTL